MEKQLYTLLVLIATLLSKLHFCCLYCRPGVLPHSYTCPCIPVAAVLGSCFCSRAVYNYSVTMLRTDCSTADTKYETVHGGCLTPACHSHTTHFCNLHDRLALMLQQLQQSFLLGVQSKGSLIDGSPTPANTSLNIQFSICLIDFNFCYFHVTPR